jgi:hypothetical protein
MWYLRYQKERRKKVDIDVGFLSIRTEPGPHPRAKVCNLCPLPTNAHSYTLATERHDVF